MAEKEANEIIANWKFHRRFNAPATDQRGEMKITYAIAGPEEGEDVPTILFCAGMFGTRYQALWFDYIAEKKGTRILVIDRFGFGDTTEVPLSQRIPTFLEIIPILLSHLKIPHVTLASHSAGTIYALNFLTTYPHLLSPTSPTVYFFSPWVHQSHTSVSFLVLASMLPDPLLSLWDNIMKFVVQSASPAFAASGGAISVVTDKFKSKETKEKEAEDERRKCEEGYGISLELKKEVDRLLFKYAFAEYTKGVNDEGRLCLKSTKGTEWYACEDYQDCVRNLAEVWERKVEQGRPKLRVNIILPEEDVMVGEKGMRYFEECWKTERRGKGIDVECVRIDGTDHESTAHPANEVMGKMLVDAKGR